MRFYVPLIAALSLLPTDMYAGKAKKNPRVEDCKEPLCIWTNYTPMPKCGTQTVRIHFFLPDHDDNHYYKITWFQDIAEEDVKKGRLGTSGSTIVNDPPRHKPFDLNNVNGNYPLNVWASLYRDGEEPSYTADFFVESCKPAKAKQ